MFGVISGFFIITVIVLTGMAVEYTGILGPHGRFVLNRLTYFVAAPCLVFSALIDSSLKVVLSPVFAVAALASVITTLTGYVVVRRVFRTPASTAVLAAVSGAMVNSANIGFPIAAYVLGDVAHALPVALWQMAFFTPAFQFALHTAVSGQRPSPRAFAAALYTNPMILAAAAGIVVLASGLKPAAFLVEPIRITAGISIPGMLLAFGMSLLMSRPFAKDSGVRREIAFATAVKLAFMPLVAFALARWAFQLSGAALFVSVVLAALPTAQNVYVAAARYETGEELSRDVALFTSLGTVVVLVIVTALLGPATY